VSAALSRRPVFRALTRPQMFAGVTYSFFVLNAAVTTEAFLMTRSFLALPIALAIHGIGYLACLREPASSTSGSPGSAAALAFRTGSAGAATATRLEVMQP
jgi:type IV secretory pathway VirB3-like protein